MADKQTIRRTTFSNRVGDTFLVRQESGTSPCVLELVDVAACKRQEPQAADDQDRDAFSVLFHDRDGSAGSYLPQGTYRLEHEEIGTLEIFVVPVGPDADGNGMRYEAVFT